ncbi:ABC transporter permease [Spirochaeta lutea]|uniref:Uncharacterized protein n=1 Tax=Spirochaeta lutea TaxID=1480694 RepID=A0A098QW59_9SPIO|nr:FtsX-like permease family protein [Spirochaeta lutea]KGE70737.1 hypothetical protein DC28_14645 [Spirochaeta lutea]
MRARLGRLFAFSFTALRITLGSGARRKGSLTRLRGGVIGVGLSIVPLIVVLHVSDGMIQGITARYIEVGSGHIQLQSRFAVEPQELSATLDSLAGIPGVVRAQPERRGLGLLRGDLGNSGVQIRGVEPEWYRDDPGVRQYLSLEEGEFRLGEDDLLIGTALARELGVGVGDEVRLLTVRRGATGALLPRVSRFVVRGLVSSGYRELDRLWVFIQRQRGLEILHESSSSDQITLKIDDPFTLPNPLLSRNSQAGQSVLEEIARVLSPQWRMVTWYDAERAQIMNFIATKNMLLVIMVVILLVAAVNVSSTMINLVEERRKELITLKSLGASPAWVMGVVLLGGGVSGGLGIILGGTAGMLCSLWINEILRGIEWVINTALFWQESIQIINPEFYLERIPVTPLVGDTLLLLAAALGVSVLASLFPALRAARLRPAEVFQKP